MAATRNLKSTAEIRAENRRSHFVGRWHKEFLYPMLTHHARCERAYAVPLVAGYLGAIDCGYELVHKRYEQVAFF